MCADQLTDAPTPAPLDAERLEELRALDAQYPIWRYAPELFAHIDALAAQVAQLSAERDALQAADDPRGRGNRVSDAERAAPTCWRICEDQWTLARQRIDRLEAELAAATARADALQAAGDALLGPLFRLLAAMEIDNHDAQMDAYIDVREPFQRFREVLVEADRWRALAGREGQ